MKHLARLNRRIQLGGWSAFIRRRRNTLIGRERMFHAKLQLSLVAHRLGHQAFLASTIIPQIVAFDELVSTLKLIPIFLEQKLRGCIACCTVVIDNCIVYNMLHILSSVVLMRPCLGMRFLL